MDSNASIPVGYLGAAPLRSLRQRFFAGARAGSPPWVRLSLAALLLGTAVLYLWSLGASGWANGFYSAAVQAGTQSWKAFLFGSFDASNFITVDKPPASLWVMELSARFFGLNSWSILVPQALEGVAAVALLYATVRRWCGAAAGLIAGAVLATTPVAVLMFRFNNPDALLVLLLVASAYALTRALERGGTRWLVLAGTLVGFGFLSKMLQALVILPVFAGVYLLAAPVPVRRRLWQVAVAGAAVVVSAGWWVALVTLWPAADRPYIGGSTDNSILNLIFGYNGFGRITGNETGSVGGMGTAGSMWGPTGIARMFNSQYGGQVSWLIPAALLLLGGVLWLRRRAPRVDGMRAQALLWGGWLLITGLVLSFAQGIIHPYYTVALAPAIGALVGIGAVAAWRQRHLLFGRALLAATVLGSSVWAFVLLDRSPAWLPWLRYTIMVAGVISAAALVGLPRIRARLVPAVAAAALATTLAAPVAYAIDTAATPHTGAIPSAGPAVAVTDGFGGPGNGGPRGGFAGRPAGAGFIPGGPGGFPPGGPGAFPPGAGAPGGQAGGLLNASRPSAALVAALQSNAASYTWVAATVGANSAAGYQLASGDPIMAIGGFNGTDAWPTLTAFQQLVSQHRIHYFIAGGRGGGPNPGGAASASSSITAWVAANFTATQVGGTTVYDLTAGA